MKSQGITKVSEHHPLTIHLIFKSEKKGCYFWPQLSTAVLSSSCPLSIHVGVWTHLSSTPVWRRGRSWRHLEGPLPRWDTTPALHSQSSSGGEDIQRNKTTLNLSKWAHMLVFRSILGVFQETPFCCCWSSSGAVKDKCLAQGKLNSSSQDRSYSLPYHILIWSRESTMSNSEANINPSSNPFQKFITVRTSRG